MARDAPQRRSYWRRNYAPLIIWLLVSGGTILCYAGGPFVFAHSSWLPLYLYLGAVHLAIITGYILGIRTYCKAKSPPVDPRRLVAIVRWLGAIAVVGLVVGVFAGGDIRAAVQQAVDDPRSARETWIAQSGSTVAGYVVVFISIVHFPLVASTFAYWKWLPARLRWQAPAVIAWAVLGSVIGGSRHGVFSFLVAAGAGAAIGAVTSRFPLRVRGLLVVGAAAALAFAVYSSFITVNRYQYRIDDYGEFLRRQTDFPVDPRHPAFDVLPKVIEPAILSGFFYFGHGYEGLAQALELPFIGIGFGAGHSRVLIRNAARILNDPDVQRYSYFDRLVLDEGLSSSLWVTIYPWIASDLTFPGSVLFMGVLAWFFATAWQDSIHGRNIYAPWLVAWIAHTIASTSSLPPGSDYGSLMSYWGSVVLWLAVRRKLNGSMHRRRTA